MASLGDEGMLQLWDLETQLPLLQIPHLANIRSAIELRFTPAGDELFLVHDNVREPLSQWSAKRKREPMNRAAVSPWNGLGQQYIAKRDNLPRDIDDLIWCDFSRTVITLEEGTVRWTSSKDFSRDEATYADLPRVRTLIDSSPNFSVLAISHDGRFVEIDERDRIGTEKRFANPLPFVVPWEGLAHWSPPQQRVVWTEDNVLVMGDTSRGVEVSRIRYPSRITVLLPLDDSTMLTGSEDGIVRCHSLVSGELLGMSSHYEGAIFSMDVSPDKRQIVMATFASTISVLDAATLLTQSTFAWPRQTLAVFWTPVGRSLLICDRVFCQYVQPTDGRLIAGLGSPGLIGKLVRISPDREHLATVHGVIVRVMPLPQID